MFAPALPIGLSSNSGITAVLSADTPGSQHDINRAKHILNAGGMVFDAPCVHEETCFGSSPQLGCLPDHLFGNACYFGSTARYPLFDMLCDSFKANCLIFNKLMIQPVVLDHQ